jgi:transcriptional regulator with XRE-family HTH domain
VRVAPKHGAQVLRKEAGRWLRELREKRGLSQRELAEKVGAEVYTLISQLEHGRGRIPPDRYLVWAEVLGIEPSELARRFT